MNLRQAYELEKLTGKFFSMDVLLLGNNIWVRSYLPTTAFLFITEYFVADLSQSVLRLVMVPVQFFLIQKAAGHVARKRFDLRVLDSCWWSVWWRATLYTFALVLVAAIVIALVFAPLFGDLGSLTSEEISERDPLNTGRDSIIIVILFYVIGSFLAVGYATLRAFRVSCIKTRQCPKYVDPAEMLEEEEREKGQYAEQQQGEEREFQQPVNKPVPPPNSVAEKDVERYAPPPGYELDVPSPEEAKHHRAEPSTEAADPEQTADDTGQDIPSAGKELTVWDKSSGPPRRGGWSNPKPENRE